MVKTCEDFIGEQCIRNNDGMLAVRDEDKKKNSENLPWKASKCRLYIV